MLSNAQNNASNPLDTELNVSEFEFVACGSDSGLLDLAVASHQTSENNLAKLCSKNNEEIEKTVSIT